ncbi:unnamed protein product [Brassica napus]|uniref:(rape) hypothetical protein n=1 Tax=Brassica napus TaxID=3708 RepID=A0A816RBW4_BRANA|nr:unnamed protein product [Brassica napus]
MLKHEFSRHETSQSSNLIPVDLLIDILTRVPAKSIARYDGNKLFLYSTHQPHNPDDDDDNDSSLGWERKVRVVCNPATGEFLTLPKVLLKEKTKLITAQKRKEKIARMYLGYDPMGKQFKVLCMTTTSSPYEVRDNTHQVLTLESGKKRVWRTIECKFHFEYALTLGLRSSALSTQTKTWNKGIINYRVYSLTLFNYKGRLEDAENHKWSKHIYELCPLEGNLIRYSRFVGMARTGEFVWSSSYNDSPNSFYLSFYSLESETFRKVKIQGFDEFKQHHRFISTYLDYVENVKWRISDKSLPRAPQNDAASGSKSKKPKSTQAHLVRKPNSIQKPSPTVLSVNDKNRACEEKSRGKRRIASSMETRGVPALYNRFAALDSLEDAG